MNYKTSPIGGAAIIGLANFASSSAGMTIRRSRNYPVRQFLAEYITTRNYSVGRQAEFDSLVTQWKRDTAKLSMVQKKAVHPAYQKIIGMGESALPFIFKELNRERDDWLWALTAITGRDNVAKPESKFDEAIDQWLNWGITNGYLLPKDNVGTGYTTTSPKS